MKVELRITSNNGSTALTGMSGAHFGSILMAARTGLDTIKRTGKEIDVVIDPECEKLIQAIERLLDTSVGGATLRESPHD